MKDNLCELIKLNTDRILSLINKINKDVTLVGVSKTFSIEHIRCAISAGIKVFGENKIQEASDKIEVLKKEYIGLEWHFIGHLQSNKVNKAIHCFDMLEAVDSVKLARKISESSKRDGVTSSVLLEVKVSGEDTKFGIDPEIVLETVQEIKGLENIKVRGLMAMAPYFDDSESARPYFKIAKELFDKVGKEAGDNIEMKYLSMGMTNDFEVAIQEGANMVRVGSGIFGDRNY